MTLPTDFDSFVSGVNLTLANYSAGSGVGNGTFTDMVTGAQDWTRGSVGPTFSNIGGSSQISAASFDNTVDSQVVRRWPFGQECTVIITAQCATFASNRALMGHPDGTSNLWSWYVSTARAAVNLYRGHNESAPSGNLATNATAFVAAYGFCPETRKAWVQMNNGTPVSDATTSANIGWVGWPSVSIGRARTMYCDGSIGRVLIFSRCLFERNTSGTHTLATLMTTECANIGI